MGVVEYIIPPSAHHFGGQLWVCPRALLYGATVTAWVCRLVATSIAHHELHPMSTNMAEDHTQFCLNMI